MSGRREGFILVAALWLIIALGAVGLDGALRNRGRRQAAANLLDQTRARTAAIAGSEYARSRLTAAMLGRADELRAEAARANQRNATNRQQSPVARSRANDVNSLFRQSDPATDPWRDPEQLIAGDWVFAGVHPDVHMRDTGAALNINEADETMLRQFFAQGLRVDYNKADKLTQAMLDWRDQDEIPRLGGGEREQYVQQGLAVLPPNRPFAEIGELRYVMGMTPDLFEQLVPYVTIVSSGRINVNAAPEPVLLALPGITPAAATLLLRIRQSGRLPRNNAELLQMMPSGARAVLELERQEFNRRVTYVTDEVEIAVNIILEGTPIAAAATVVVARSNTGAVVVWRKVE